MNVVGAITSAAHDLPRMAARGHGTFVITGGMPEAVPDFLSLSLGKAGVRALVEALDAQYAPAGVHVATVTVDGPVAPGTDFDPDDIAEHYRAPARPAPTELGSRGRPQRDLRTAPSLRDYSYQASRPTICSSCARVNAGSWASTGVPLPSAAL